MQSNILPADRGKWPEPARFEYEERAAILEYCEGYSRAAAEAAAEIIVREDWPAWSGEGGC